VRSRGGEGVAIANEGSTPPNGIEVGKRTTESNQGSNPRIRNPKSEIRNPQFE